MMVHTLIEWLRQRLINHQFRPGTRQYARRRLRRLVLGSLLCLAIPLVLLLSRVYTYLEREMVYQYRAAAEELAYRINQRLAEVLHTEENRAFDEYSFLKVTTNPLLQGTAVTTSPLSELPPRSTVPGVIGYFQINPDGSVQSPVLPALSEAELAAHAERFGFGAAELDKRLTLRRRLERLLRAGTPGAQPQSSSALPLSESIGQSADASLQVGRYRRYFSCATTAQVWRVTRCNGFSSSSTAGRTN
jgi:hypothetical protein